MEYLSHKSVADEDTVQRLAALVNSFAEFGLARSKSGGADADDVPSRLRKRVLSKVSTTLSRVLCKYCTV